MKKLFIATTLSLGLLASSANAAIGFALTGGWALYFKIIGGGLAVAGLVSDKPLSGTYSNGSAVIFGLLTLEGKDGDKILFKDMPVEDLEAIGLTDNEIRAYNGLNEEISVAFNESVSHLSEDSTSEDLNALLEVHREVLGPDAISAGNKVLQYNMHNL